MTSRLQPTIYIILDNFRQSSIGIKNAHLSCLCHSEWKCYAWSPFWCSKDLTYWGEKEYFLPSCSWKPSDSEIASCVPLWDCRSVLTADLGWLWAQEPHRSRQKVRKLLRQKPSCVQRWTWWRPTVERVPATVAMNFPGQTSSPWDWQDAPGDPRQAMGKRRRRQWLGFNIRLMLVFHVDKKLSHIYYWVA